MIKGAEFSECRKYRYCLWRIWDETLPKVMFIGLNPSTANEETDDPTIRRVIAFAKKWGYGGVYMMNCFSYVSTDPRELSTVEDRYMNDVRIAEKSKEVAEIIFAWGSFGEAKGRASVLSVLYPNARALVINKDGSPRHPLYVRTDTIPVPFKS